MSNAKQSFREYFKEHADARRALDAFIAERSEILRTALEVAPPDQVLGLQAELRATRELSRQLTQATQEANRGRRD